MRNIVFSPDAMSQVRKFKFANPKLVFKIFELIDNIQK